MSLRARSRGLVPALLLVVLVAAGCTSDPEPEPEPSADPIPSSTGPVELTFAVYGPPPVVTAYTKIASDFSAANPDVVVNVRPYDTRAEAMAALAKARERGTPPDLFLMDRQDLPALAAEGAVRRVDDLLGQRQVNFGDGYTRNGLEAFSADSALQCMPADVSPLLVYYNPRLINLSAVPLPGRNPVGQETGWSLDEFARAALQARGPGVRGLYVEPDLAQIAPFIWSGGGELVDDEDEPTRLTLSEGGTARPLERLLEVVRDPAITFGQKAMKRRGPLERFKAGQLGMILGDRSLVPELRRPDDFFFDVMPLPRLGSTATLGTMRGLCIASGSEHVQQAADLLAAVVSVEGARTLAATGYVMPPNLDVLNSDAFLQREQQPVHSEVFVRRVRDARQLPDSPHWGDVSAATAPLLEDLFYQPVILPLQQRLEAIDDASVPLFDPGTPSASPSASVGREPTPAPTRSP